MNRLQQLEQNLERAHTYGEYMKILELLAQEEIKQEFGTYTWGKSPIGKTPQRYVFQTSDSVLDNMVGPEWINTYNVKLPQAPEIMFTK